MGIGDSIDSYSPTRHISGLRNPNYKAPQQPDMNQNGFLQPHERTGYFEQNPRQALQAFEPQFGTGRKRRTLMDSLNPIMDEYLGGLGRQIMSGGNPPVGGFSDFLGGTRGYDKPFDFNSFYYQNNPGATARGDAQFDPSIRYQY